VPIQKMCDPNEKHLFKDFAKDRQNRYWAVILNGIGIALFEDWQYFCSFEGGGKRSRVKREVNQVFQWSQ